MSFIVVGTLIDNADYYCGQIVLDLQGAAEWVHNILTTVMMRNIDFSKPFIKKGK